MKWTNTRKRESAKSAKNKEFTYKERVQIETLIKQGKTYREIGDTINKSKSAVYEEVKKNGGKENYNAEKSDNKRCWKRYRAKRKCMKVSSSTDLMRYLEKKLRQGWSPETISKRLKTKKQLPHASPKAIRKFIASRPSLERFLYSNRINKKSGKKKSKGSGLTDRVFIEERGDIQGIRGHWEGDFVVSKKSSWVLLVLVEIVSKTVVIRRLPNRINDLVNSAIADALDNYEVNSLTLDNDIAFQKHKKLSEMINAPIFFCHPYCSWEKPLVENTNKSIRDFIAKKVNIGTISNYYIQQIEDWLNYTPRQILGGYAPIEILGNKKQHPAVVKLEVALPDLVRIGG